MTDRRTATRLPVDVRATIVSDDGVVRIDVDVANLSRQGAGIAIPASQMIPDRFYMLFPDHRIQPCALVWRGGDAAGLRFQ